MTAIATPAPEVTQDVVGEPVKVDKNYFAELAGIDVKNFIEKKNGFSYLSWASAVDQLKRKHPTAQIITKRFPDPDLGGAFVPYMKTSLGYFVEVEVIVDGNSVSEPFPVLDYRNKPIPKPTAFDINNSIQRAKVKSIAGHGLGLYIYAGEDIPIESDDKTKQQQYAPQQYQQQVHYQQQPQYQQHIQAQQHQVFPITEPQKLQMRDLATQIASLTLGAGATQEAIVAKLGDVYGQYKITANLTSEQAAGIIAQLTNGVKEIHDSRLQQSQANMAPPADLFGNVGTQDLANVI